MRHTAILLLAALHLIYPPGDLSAQDQTFVYPGDTIRVTTTGIGDWLRGILVDLDAECVILSGAGGHGADLLLPRTSIRRMEVRRGLHWVPVPPDSVSLRRELPSAVARDLQAILKEGDRVRLTRPENSAEWIQGSVVSLDLERVLLASGDRGDGVAIPLDSINRLQILRQKTKAGKGALIGGLVGIVPGAVAGTGLCSLAEGSASGCIPMGVTGAFLVGAVTAGLGALIGSMSKAEVWEPVTLERLSISIMATGGFAIGLSLSVGPDSGRQRPGARSERRRG